MSSTQKDFRENSNFEFLIIVAACLLIAVALISLLGTFPTDPLPSEVQGSHVANALIALTSFSGARSLYSSLFFILLLGILGSFVIYALIRQAKLLFNHHAPIVFAPISNVRFLPLGTQSVKTRLEKALRSFGYRVQFFNDETKIEGAKNLSGRLGPLGIHLGFVIVLLAGLLTFLGSDIRETEVREGEVLTLPKEQIGLRLDKFIVFRHAGSDRPSQYTSRFWIKGADGRGRHIDLSVNHPLKLGRTKIFQMRYRIEIPRAEIIVYKNMRPVQQVLLEAGKPYALTPKGQTLSYDKIVPDFKLTRDGIISTGSSYERSALRLKIGDSKGSEKTLWIFPAAFGPHGGSDKERQYSILKLHKVYFSGVRVSYDPGLPIAYSGFILLIFSAFYSSFAIPRRLRLTWHEDQRYINVIVEGWCPRDPSGLEEETNRLVKGLS